MAKTIVVTTGRVERQADKLVFIPMAAEIPVGRSGVLLQDFRVGPRGGVKPTSHIMPIHREVTADGVLSYRRDNPAVLVTRR